MAKLTKPIKIHGGKDTLAPKIVKLFPKTYLSYVEPYAGGCSVMLAANPEGHSEVVNDLDGELMNFWEVLQHANNFDIFSKKMAAIPFSEATFQKMKNMHDGHYVHTAHSPVVRAVNFFVAARQSLSGRRKDFAAISTNRVRRGMNEQVSAWLTAVEGLPAVHERLKRVLILNRKALDVIRQLDNRQTLFYLDPPYLHSTRRTTKEYGQFEMSEDDHNQLLQVLSLISGKFILSGYRSELYDSYAKHHKWRRVEFKQPNLAAGGKKKRIMTECCWMNY